MIDNMTDARNEIRRLTQLVNRLTEENETLRKGLADAARNAKRRTGTGDLFDSFFGGPS